MLGRVVDAPVLELDARVASERERVGDQEAVGRLDEIPRAYRRLCVRRADRMSGQRQRRDLSPVPVVASGAPLLRAGSLTLRRLAVVEEEARIALEGAEVGLVGEDERRADEGPAPVAAALGPCGVEKDEVEPRRGRTVVHVRRVEEPHVPRRIGVHDRTRLPADAGHGRAASDELDVGGVQQRHRPVRRQLDPRWREVDDGRQRLDQVLGAVAVEERPGAEEEGDWRVDRRRGASVPRDAQVRGLEGGARRGRDDEPQDAKGRGPIQVGDRHRPGRREIDGTRAAGHARAGGRDVGACRREERDHVARWRRRRRPRGDRPGQRRARIVERVDEVPRAVVRVPVRDRERLREPHRYPRHVGALGGGVREGERWGERRRGQERRRRGRGVRRRRRRVAHDLVGAVDAEVPRAAVPVVCAEEGQHSGPGDVERDVVAGSVLAQIVARVGRLVAAGAVVGAAHVRAGPDADVRQARPVAVRVLFYGDDRRGAGRSRGVERRNRGVVGRSRAVEHGVGQGMRGRG